MTQAFYYLFQCGRSTTYAIGRSRAVERLLPKDHDGRKWKFISKLPTDKLGVYTLYTATIMASEEFHIFKLTGL